MTKAQAIADSLGRDEIAARIGIRREAVDKAVRSGKLPSAWFVALCDMNGEILDHDAFTFKGVASVSK